MEDLRQRELRDWCDQTDGEIYDTDDLTRCVLSRDERGRDTEYVEIDGDVFSVRSRDEDEMVVRETKITISDEQQIDSQTERVSEVSIHLKDLSRFPSLNARSFVNARGDDYVQRQVEIER